MTVLHTRREIHKYEISMILSSHHLQGGKQSQNFQLQKTQA